MNYKNYVLCIAGVSGSGKSTIAVEMHKMVKNSVPLFFDSYFSLSSFPDDFDYGPVFNEWKTPAFSKDISELKNNKPITHPIQKKEIKPAKLIIIDDMTGRERDEMKNLIDFVVLLDYPNELSMARVFKKIAEYCGDDLKKLKETIIEHYDDCVRNRIWDYNIKQNNLVRKNADMIIKFEHPPKGPKDIAKDILNEFKERFNVTLD
jgi:uridine kinase